MTLICLIKSRSFRIIIKLVRAIEKSSVKWALTRVPLGAIKGWSSDREMAFTRIIITARNTLSGTRLSRDLEDLTRIFRRFQKAYLVLFSYMGQKYFGKCPGKQKKSDWINSSANSSAIGRTWLTIITKAAHKLTWALNLLPSAPQEWKSSCCDPFFRISSVLDVFAIQNYETFSQEQNYLSWVYFRECENKLIRSSRRRGHF